MKDILDKVGRNDGFKVPEGYFESFAETMAQRLPPNDLERSASRDTAVLPRSVWQRVRPYVYMAAMFLGVWCMMNMTDFLRPADTTSPELAAALGNDQFMGDYIVNDGSYDDYDLIETLYDEGFSPASLDFSDSTDSSAE